ncbi:MAG: nitrophenyl compound nitroreductase subunit ArsF family protein [bacterium]
MTGNTAVKTFFRVALLLFVAGSVGYLFAKEYGWRRSEAPVPAAAPSAVLAEKTTPATPDRVVAYYFHGDFRCATCRKLEEYSRVAIEEGFPAELKDGRLSFAVVNIERPENRHFIRDYSLVSKSVVLSLKAGDRELRFKNLNLIWQLVGSRETFINYVQGEAKKFLAEVKR